MKFKQKTALIVILGALGVLGAVRIVLDDKSKKVDAAIDVIDHRIARLDRAGKILDSAEMPTRQDLIEIRDALVEADSLVSFIAATQSVMEQKVSISDQNEFVTWLGDEKTGRLEASFHFAGIGRICRRNDQEPQKCTDMRYLSTEQRQLLNNLACNVARTSQKAAFIRDYCVS